jgi:hypothetical protein
VIEKIIESKMCKNCMRKFNCNLISIANVLPLSVILSGFWTVKKTEMMDSYEFSCTKYQPDGEE